MSRNPWLIVGGWLSFAASLLHIGCIVGGPDWYRFFGAGEAMAGAAERGETYPALVTFAIAVILAIWAAYAFAGAGLIRRLPLMRTALVAITAIYLLRGAALIPALTVAGMGGSFNIWSSVIVLGYGLAYAVGTWRAWPFLSPTGRLA
ncbi:MAG: hypothetical protein M3Q83_01700 [Pseudomonadota bacterium]|nr:hypothetical protein [Pseudomonadota bacterium]